MLRAQSAKMYAVFRGQAVSETPNTLKRVHASDRDGKIHRQAIKRAKKWKAARPYGVLMELL